MQGDRLPPVQDGSAGAGMRSPWAQNELSTSSSGRRGVSVGSRAAERVRQKSQRLAAVVHQERAERLSTHLLKGESGGSPRIATEDECTQMSLTLNQRMIEVFPDPQARSWYKLFNHMDDDCSGKISFYEWEDMVRNELKMGPAKIADEQIKAIWRALDEDKSGLITSGEFGHFMRRGAHIHNTNEHWKDRVYKERTAKGEEVRAMKQDLRSSWRNEKESLFSARKEHTTSLREAKANMSAWDRNRQVNAAKAAVVRKERDERLHRHLLKAADGSSAAPRIATEEEAQQVAVVLNQRMCEVIQDPQARSWYKLFVHMDDDLSGKISYHELEDMIRHELKMNSMRLSDEQLQAIWRYLDEDQSGLISCGEFGHFMRLGMHVLEVKEPAQDKLFKAKANIAASIREEKTQMLNMWKEDITSDQANKRKQAVKNYEAAWGLSKVEQKPAFKSPRALIF
mmetsp:Transcript_41625/g.77552  ORF Transcript_41625/g.77552 Transcript_41625/m.77552 type:complete len:455 (-) Transcript_41625:35-1399(-)